MVICQACHSLYSFEDCIEKRGSQIFVHLHCECQSSGKSIPLLKQVVTRQGSQKLYTFLVYPTPIHHSHHHWKVPFLCPGLLDLCEDWRQNSTDLYNNVYDGQIWKDFLHYQNATFLSDKNTIG